MDRHRALVIPGFLVLSSSRRKSRDKRARFAPFTDSIPPLAGPLFFPNEMQETCGQGARGKSLKAVRGSEKSVDGALDAAGCIGIGRWLSPDFLFSPLQGGNPVINALASLFLTIPSLRWPASLLK
jgi:hypothetical protein